MANPIDPALAQAINDAARQLSRLASSFQGGASTVSQSATQIGGTLKTVGSSMVRLRNDLDRGRVSNQQASASLAELRDQLIEIESVYGKSAASERIRQHQMSMASDLLTRTLGDQAAGLTKSGFLAAFEYYKNQVFVAAKGIQDNTGGMQTAFNLQSQALTDQIAILTKLSTGATEAATALALIPHPLARLAAGITGGSAALAALGKEMLSLEQEALNVLQKESVNTAESFKASVAAGALFAQGLMDTRNFAKDAGLSLTEFGKIVAQNGDTLSLLGGTVAGGVEKFTRVGKALDSSRLGLFKLGFSAEQQSQAVIDYMEILQKTGQNINKSPEQLAIGTRDYLINLRALSAATGEDVKKIQARQREASMQAAVNAKLSESSAETGKKFRDLIGRFPGYEKAIQQLFAVGEVVDPVLAVTLANNKELDQALRQGVANIENNNVTQEQAYRETEKYLSANGAAIRDNARQMQKITGTAALTTGALQDYADMSTKGVLIGTRAAEQGAESTLDQAKNLAETTDQLTGNMAELDKAFVESARLFNQDINPLLQKNSAQLMDIFVEGQNKLRKALGLINRTIEEFQGRPPAPRPADRGNRSGEARAGESQMGETTPAFARGGIADGPLSGFLARLHGTEAIVPLPEGRSIPVSFKFDNSELANKDLNSGLGSALSSFKQVIESTVSKTIPSQTESNVPMVFESMADKSKELATIMSSVKTQLETSTQQQLSIMQQQIDKLDSLVSVMQDNARYSERIANELT
jgi:hypothetical protein